MRRGDLSTASAAREMPASYYINVVKNLIQVCSAAARQWVLLDWH
jgi:hypothetical protein